MNKVLFSVATPTRNSLDKLKRCVGSVRGQNNVTVEHIIQDAQSTDGTPAWLEGQSCLRATSENDAGMYDAINKAWARASGDFLSWLNSDEQYLPGTLTKVQTYFDAHPEVDVVFGDYIVTDPHGHPVALRREIPFRKFYVANSFLNMQSATIFFRRKLWDSGILRINSKYRYAADKDLILRIANAGHLIHHIPDYFSLFGIDGTNLSTHPQMGKESEEIRIAFGAYKSQPLRKLALMGRRLERLFIGSYRSKSISYKYALNEEPRYEDHTATNLGGRYALTAFTGQANSLRNTYSK